MGWGLAEESRGESLAASSSEGKARRGSCFGISLHSKLGEEDSQHFWRVL